MSTCQQQHSSLQLHLTLFNNFLSVRHSASVGSPPPGYVDLSLKCPHTAQTSPTNPEDQLQRVGVDCSSSRAHCACALHLTSIVCIYEMMQGAEKHSVARNMWICSQVFHSLDCSQQDRFTLFSSLP